MSIEENIERIANALENIARCMSDTSDVVTSKDAPTNEAPVVLDTPPTKKKAAKKTSKKKAAKKSAPEPTAPVVEGEVIPAASAVTQPPTINVPTPPPMQSQAPVDVDAMIAPPAQPGVPAGLTYEDILQEVGNIARALGPHGAEIGTLLNTTYQVQRLSDLDPSYYDQFIMNVRQIAANHGH